MFTLFQLAQGCVCVNSPDDSSKVPAASSLCLFKRLGAGFCPVAPVKLPAEHLRVFLNQKQSVLCYFLLSLGFIQSKLCSSMDF